MTVTSARPLLNETTEATKEITSANAAAGDSITVAVWTMVSRGTGVIKVAAIGAVLGPTFFGNVYQFSNSLPNLVYYGFLAGSLFASLLVPALVSSLDKGETRTSGRIAGGFLGIVLAALVVVVPLVALVAPWLLQLTSPGSIGGQQQYLARVLVALLIPQVFLYAVVGSSTAVQNARRRFALAAAAPALENVGTITVLLATYVIYGHGRDIGDIPSGEVLLLGIGSTASVGLHAVIQWWGARRAGVLLRPRLGWRDPDVRVLVRRALRSLGQAGLFAAQMLALLLLANRVRGGVVAMQIALNFFALPIALGATPVALSVLPRLARTHGRGDDSAFRVIQARAMSLALFVAIPAGAGYVVLAEPLAHAVAFGDLSSGRGVTLVAICLASLAVGVPGQTAFQVASYSAYARHDISLPLRAMVMQALVFATLCLPSLLVRGDAVLVLLGSAYSIANGVSAVLLQRTVGAPRSKPARHLRDAVLRTGASATLMALVVWGLLWALSWFTSGRSRSIFSLVLGTGVGLVTYLALQAYLKAPEIGWLRGGLRGEADDEDDVGTTRVVPPDEELPGVGHFRVRPVRRGVAVTSRQLRHGALMVGLLVASGGVAAAAVAAPGMALLGGVAVGCAVALWRCPALGAYLILGITPLVAGIDRGVVLPLFRPNEGLALFVAAVLATRALLRLRTGEIPRLRLNRVEVAILLMAVCNSVVPLVWMLLIHRPITGDDISYALVMWKYLGLYAIIRFSVENVEQVRRCIWVSMAAAIGVGLIAILQSLGLFGVPRLLSTYYAPFGNTQVLDRARGSATLGLPAAVADLMIYNLALAVGLLLRYRRHRLLLGSFAMLFVFSTLSAGEFSSAMGLVIGVLCLALVTGSLALLRYFIPVAALGGAAMWPVIETRLAGFQSTSGLPVSWTGRLHNLQNYFWPELFSHGNWVFGVRPAARIATVHKANQYIWIESGYSWCLWGGGVPLLLSFLYFVYAAGQDAWRIAKRRADEVGVLASATFTSIVVMAVLMVFDPHLTYRGSADALFASLALMRVGSHGRGPTTSAIKRASTRRGAEAASNSPAGRAPADGPGVPA